MVLAVVWHYWFAVVLMLFMVIPAIIALVAFFLTKTQAPRYERIKE